MTLNADFGNRVVIDTRQADWRPGLVPGLGDYPTGTWIRSPHLSRHQPFSAPGCLIYVKVGHLADE
jgi:hypothetical protein